MVASVDASDNYFFMIDALHEIENQLKKRLPYHYQWGRIQNNQWDDLTNFIYHTKDWEHLIDLIKQTLQKHHFDKKAFFNYAANRWYNFWSAMAVEQIFTSLEGVEAVQDYKDSEKDFIIQGIPFDHKTSVFPKKFNSSFMEAKENPRTLINWLYRNQSTQKRYHLKNRIFIVVCQQNGEHWKLKSEIKLIKVEIEKYIQNFKPSQLQKFIFTPQTQTLSDIIWLIK
ncbi:MAG: hypothetical protein ACWA45_02475 [Flavobacteriales bacterium]